MSEQAAPVGIKETQELALGAIALGFHITKLLKDGFQAQDLGSFLDKLKNDEAFAKKIQDAYEGVAQVPSEIKDLNLTEGLQLAMVVVPAVVAEVGSL